MFAILFGGVQAMIPVYAKDILKVDPIGFGWLNAAIDIGSICVVILLTITPLKRAQGKKLLLAVGGFGIVHYIICIVKMVYSFIFCITYSRHARWCQCCHQGHSHATENPGPYAGPGKQREFYVYQFQQ